jgi:hypothetical protein
LFLLLLLLLLLFFISTHNQQYMLIITRYQTQIIFYFHEYACLPSRPYSLCSESERGKWARCLGASSSSFPSALRTNSTYMASVQNSLGRKPRMRNKPFEMPNKPYDVNTNQAVHIPSFPQHSNYLTPEHSAPPSPHGELEPDYKSMLSQFQFLYSEKGMPGGGGGGGFFIFFFFIIFFFFFLRLII